MAYDSEDSGSVNGLEKGPAQKEAAAETARDLKSVQRRVEHAVQDGIAAEESDIERDVKAVGELGGDTAAAGELARTERQETQAAGTAAEEQIQEVLERGAGEGATVLEAQPPELRTFLNPTFKGEDPEVASRQSKTEVLLSNKRFVNGDEDKSQGFFGAVYSVDIRIPGDKKGKVLPFVLKEFHVFGGNEEAAKTVAQAALRNHRRAKEAGLKVWQTYRVEEDGKSILMSTGNAKEWKVMGNSRLSEKEAAEFLPIANFDSFIENYYAQAAKAAKNNIFIEGDVPFLLARKHDIDFILGDMDSLMDLPDEKEADILKRNIQSMHSYLVAFFEDACGEDAAEEYIQRSKRYLQDKFQQTVTRYGDGTEKEE